VEVSLVVARGQPEAVARTRIAYFDWLRVIAILGVFVYHCLQPFSADEWHIKNAPLTDAATIPVVFFGSWGIGFFFLVAGASASLALRHRTAGGYLKKRLMRLGIPLAVGYVLLAPIQAYLEETHYGRYSGSFIAFVPSFLRQLLGELHGPIADPLVIGHAYHLWFLVFLLWFSILALPLFLWMRGRGHEHMERFAAHAARRGWTLLLSIPLTAVTVAVWAASPDEHAYGEFVYYLAFFILGFVLLADARLADAVRRDVWLAVGAALIGGAVLVVSGLGSFLDRWADAPRYSLEYAWIFAFVGIQAWAWATAALGWGMRTFREQLPPSVAAAAMPFFILHQPVIVAVSFEVVRWDAAILPKFLSVLTISFVITAVLSWMVIRSPGLRTLFGVKRRGAGTTGGRVSSARVHEERDVPDLHRIVRQRDELGTVGPARGR
jgi:glucan biosynthesis protein C